MIKKSPHHTKAWQALFKFRAVRSSVYRAMNTWQYLSGSRVRLYELGISAWRKMVSSLPVRDHQLVCDADATSPLSMPNETRALVTTVRDANLEHFDEVLHEAERLAGAPDVEEVFDAMTKGGDRYQYRLPLNPRDVTDPRNAVFVKFALQPKIAGLVANYFRMPCQLNEAKVLLYRPTSGSPLASQNWHRDPEDWMTVSVIVYLNEVGAGAAPFCYVPLNHSRKLYGRSGRFREFRDWRVTPDTVMEKMVPREHWVEVTGPKGTVVFIDSASCYHRGKQAVSGRRLSLQLIFTSTFTRMDLMEKEWARLLRPESERKYAFESPLYSIASSSPLRSEARRAVRPVEAPASRLSGER